MSRTVDEHFKGLLKQLHLENLVRPNTPDKIRELERACEIGKRLSDQLKQFFDMGIKAAAEFRYLNNIIPNERIGDKLINASFTSLKMHQLTVRDLASIVDYAVARVRAHTASSGYDMQYYEQDKLLAKLPEQVKQITNNSPGHAGYFLKYLKHIALEASLDKLTEFYAEFKEIVHEGILSAGPYYAGLLEVKRLGKSWDAIKSEKSGDENALKWINKFEKLEKKYSNRNLPEIARLYVPAIDSNL
ncbi:MAG: hypothetical protein QW165_05470 [Candidatus Woesearchaeota archaeon]